jgi:SAM-dependent methyltransferase
VSPARRRLSCDDEPVTGSVCFDRMADRYDATRGGEARGAAVARALLPHLPPGPVLEIGVGTGLVAAGLAALGRDVVGVDLSPAMLARARDRLPGRVAVADAEHLPVADASVAACAAVHVLHLVGDVGRVLAEVSRVLGEDGRLVAVVIGRDVESDDVSAVMAPMEDQLRGGRPRQDDPALVGPLAEEVGLRVLLEEDRLEEAEDRTPAEVADGIEQRLWSRLWDVAPQTWAAVVQPAVQALRHLPDQDRARRLVPRRRLLVLGR